MHMNQLNNAREKLKSYENKRDNLRGLDDLTVGIGILVCYLESGDIPDHKIAKNMVIAYLRDSFRWVKGVLKNYSDDSSAELRTLNYCNELMNEFEEADKLIGTENEFDHLKQLIEKRITDIRFPDFDIIMSGIRKLSDEEQGQAISLLERLGLLPMKSRMRP